MIKININHILSIIVAILLILCCASIYAPLHFSNEKSSREALVKERLMAIRHAEETFKKKNGVYTNSFKVLIDCNLLADSMQYVPFSGGKSFELAATIYRGKSGTQVSLMECSAQFSTYLNGLSEKRIEELTENANNRGNFPGLKIGDIITPNDNAGNWE